MKMDNLAEVRIDQTLANLHFKLVRRITKSSVKSKVCTRNDIRFRTRIASNQMIQIDESDLCNIIEHHRFHKAILFYILYSSAE